MVHLMQCVLQHIVVDSVRKSDDSQSRDPNSSYGHETWDSIMKSRFDFMNVTYISDSNCTLATLAKDSTA